MFTNVYCTLWADCELQFFYAMMIVLCFVVLCIIFLFLMRCKHMNFLNIEHWIWLLSLFLSLRSPPSLSLSLSLSQLKNGKKERTIKIQKKTKNSKQNESISGPQMLCSYCTQHQNAVIVNIQYNVKLSQKVVVIDVPHINCNFPDVCSMT